MINIVEKIVNFNKQDKAQGLKLLTPKKMLQRLLIALAQVKTGNTFRCKLAKWNLWNFVSSKTRLLKKYIKM